MRRRQTTESLAVQMPRDVAHLLAFGINNCQFRIFSNSLVVVATEGDNKSPAIQESVVRSVGPLMNVSSVNIVKLPLQDAVEDQQFFGRQVRELLPESRDKRL